MLPFVLLGVAVAAGGYGVKKGTDARASSKDADDTVAEAQCVDQASIERLEEARAACGRALEGLGRRKLEVWGSEMHRFEMLYNLLKPLELIRQDAVSYGLPPVSEADAMRFESGVREAVRTATSVSAGAVGASTFVAAATWGAVGSFAAASTGTAIGSLSGAAAVNATLAWFGGGSLAAGGLGMAGGMAVLGGIVTGPLLAVGGSLWAARAEKRLNEARVMLAQARELEAKRDAAVSMIDALIEVIVLFGRAIRAMRARLNLHLDALVHLIQTRGVDYRAYSREERQLVHHTVLCAQVMKATLDAPFMREDGSVIANAIPPRIPPQIAG